MCDACRREQFLRDEIDAFNDAEMGYPSEAQLAPGTLVMIPDVAPDKRYVIVRYDSVLMSLPGLYALDLETFEMYRLCRQGDPTKSGFVKAIGTIESSTMTEIGTGTVIAETGTGTKPLSDRQLDDIMNSVWPVDKPIDPEAN